MGLIAKIALFRVFEDPKFFDHVSEIPFHRTHIVKAEETALTGTTTTNFWHQRIYRSFTFTPHLWLKGAGHFDFLFVSL